MLFSVVEGEREEDWEEKEGDPYWERDYDRIYEAGCWEG